MNILEAQNDMRQSYFAGAPGVFASGLVWLFAGLAAIFSTQNNSVIVFFFGGMMIFPLGVLFSKLLKRSGKHNEANPISKLTLESTIILFIGLFISYLILGIQPDWFYPIMLLIIGGRYFSFSTMYGMRIYWGLGLILILVGAGSLIMDFSFHVGALLGGVIELLSAFVIFYLEKNRT